MKRLRFRGFIKTAVLALALNGAVQAAPLILATVQGTTCAVTVTLQALTFSGSEREFVELPNWRALGMATAPATDTEASAWSVTRSSC